MVDLQRTFISILSFVLMLASASAQEAADISDWQSYTNTESGFSFMYPKDWEVVDDFFYKTDYVATIQKIGGSKDTNNWIRINSPQFMEEDGKCIEVEKQRICTYSKDADVLDIFVKLAGSFKLMPDRVDEKDQVWSFK